MSDLSSEERPPLFPRWAYWYALVIGFLLLQILLFSLFTQHFS